jgi:acetylornithine deacetylase
MDTTDVIALARELVSIPSVTNDEGAVCAWVAERLRAGGWHVVVQEVPPEGDARPALPRLNVLALDAPGVVPDVVITTHLDTVPPFIALTEDDEHLYGRGTCDAKGIFAAQWVAAERLRRAGHRGVALLGVVGEETDSWGAKRVPEILPAAGWILNGEPTELVPASGAKGILALDLSVRGTPCHSAYPELGRSALHVLIAALERLLTAELPSEPEFGESTVNVGLMAGGIAPNVLAPAATATALIRLGAPADAVLAAVQRILGPDVELTITSKADPHRIHVPEGHRGEVVRFGSDLPYLARIGRPLMVGPGSIHDAHTAHERVRKADLVRAAALYETLALALLEHGETARQGDPR